MLPAQLYINVSEGHPQTLKKLGHRIKKTAKYLVMCFFCCYFALPK
jgi:hypothetical protein